MQKSREGLQGFRLTPAFACSRLPQRAMLNRIRKRLAQDERLQRLLLFEAILGMLIFYVVADHMCPELLYRSSHRNLDGISRGMTENEAQSLLGWPLSVQTKEVGLCKYRYLKRDVHDGELCVILRNEPDDPNSGFVVEGKRTHRFRRPSHLEMILEFIKNGGVVVRD